MIVKDFEIVVKDLQRVLIACCNYVDDNGRVLGNKCSSCEFWSDTNRCCCSYGRKEAEAIYNAGYLKMR